MKRLALFPLAIASIVASPAFCQEYWEYEPLENETERHFPTEGLEYEYEDDGDFEVEAEQYEWEPGEGYHEQEWYDPSDWFEIGSDMDYETDDYEYDYYDYEYDGYYDDYDYDYDYVYDWDDDDDVDYEFDQQVTGRVQGLQRLRSTEGMPRSVRLKLETDDGQTRTLHLGDLSYVTRYLPGLRKGDDIVVGGEYVQRNGKRVFQAKELRADDNAYLIPDYEYRRRINGELQGIRRVRTQNQDVEMVVAKVRTDDGETIDIRIGEGRDMGGLTRTMKRGDKVRVDGYRREVDGQSSFVVQDFKVLNRDRRNNSEQRQKSSGDQASRNQSRENNG